MPTSDGLSHHDEADSHIDIDDSVSMVTDETLERIRLELSVGGH